MTHHLVQLKFKGDSFDAKVSTEGCKCVDDFRETIRNKFTSFLSSYESAQLTLFQPDGTTEIDPSETIEWLNEMMINQSKPLLVTVYEMPLEFLPSSKTMKRIYKRLAVEQSCVKYLDTIAVKLFSLYSFNRGADNSNSSVTFDDVLFARDTNQWSHRYRNDGSTVDEQQLAPLCDTDLPEFFAEDHWKHLEKMNNETNTRLYDGKPIKSGSGKDLLILPKEFCDKETVDLLRRAAIQFGLYEDESMLEIRRESD